MENEQDEFIGLPDWVQYIATDFNGDTGGYENKPVKSCNHKWFFDPKNGLVILIKRNKSAGKNWENSLIERKK